MSQNKDVDLHYDEYADCLYCHLKDEQIETSFEDIDNNRFGSMSVIFDKNINDQLVGVTIMDAFSYSGKQWCVFRGTHYASLSLPKEVKEVVEKWYKHIKTYQDSLDKINKNLRIKLFQNDHKPGWKNDSHHALLHRLEEEVKELAHEINENNIQSIKAEATDVAAFAMMIVDNCE